MSFKKKKNDMFFYDHLSKSGGFSHPFQPFEIIDGTEKAYYVRWFYL